MHPWLTQYLRSCVPRSHPVVGVDRRWRASAAEGRIHLDELQVVPTLARALQRAAELQAETLSGAHPTWRALLERLRR